MRQTTAVAIMKSLFSDAFCAAPKLQEEALEAVLLFRGTLLIATICYDDH